MPTLTAPDRTEAAEYYFTYIDQVKGTDICQILKDQTVEMLAVLEGISEERSLYRYAPGKWNLKEVLNHVNDGERLFVFRAFWFARDHDSPLPSFDQNVAVSAADANARSWKSHVEEFRAVRSATIPFFENLPEEAWSCRGIASDNPVTVRALAFIAAGHVAHHMRIIRERYLQDA